MTRLLAFGDTQLGVGTVDLADQRVVLDRIVQVALERDVDAVLHGGDVFEGPVVTPEQLRTFLNGVAPLRAHGIPLLLIRGNGRHDMAVREVHALDVLREVEGITVCDSPTVSILANKVAVCCLPWVHPGRLIASMNGSLTHEEADLTTSQMLVRIAKHLHRQALHLYPMNPPPGMLGPLELPTVLLAHWAISGSALPTGLPVDEMREPILSWADLDAIGFDAIIGAHIHKGQQISQPLIDQTLGIVVGSPQPLNHGESGYEHGAWIVEVGDGPASAEFVPIESKQFVTLDVDLAGEGDLVDPTEWLTTAFSPLTLARYKGAVVRFRFTATEDQARRVDHDAIRAALANASRVTIEPQIIREERARAQQISESLSPVDALAEFCDANDVEPDRALAMLARLKEWSE